MHSAFHVLLLVYFIPYMMPFMLPCYIKFHLWLAVQVWLIPHALPTPVSSSQAHWYSTCLKDCYAVLSSELSGKYLKLWDVMEALKPFLCLVISLMLLHKISWETKKIKIKLKCMPQNPTHFPLLSCFIGIYDSNMLPTLSWFCHFSLSKCLL